MRTNQFSIQLLGNIAGESTAEIQDFLDVIGNLWVQSIFKLVQKVSATGITVFQFVVPYDFELPIDIAAVVEYDKTLDDSVATERLTAIQKPIVTQGDLVVAMSSASLEAELNDYLQIDISEITGVAGAQIWIGFAAASESDFYTPFAGALAYRVFDKQSSKALVQNTMLNAAVSNAQKVKAIKQN